MSIYEFVTARNRKPTAGGECAALVRDMYGRYVPDMEAKGYRTVPIEEFIFGGHTQYFWPAGAIVKRKGADDGRAYIVKGYDHLNGTVVLSQDGRACACDLEPADIPEDILAVARQQIEAKMAENCPLKEMACLA